MVNWPEFLPALLAPCAENQFFMFRKVLGWLWAYQPAHAHPGALADGFDRCRQEPDQHRHHRKYSISTKNRGS